MTLSEFKNKFYRHWVTVPLNDYPFLTSSRPAAVLVLLQELNNELWVIFTKRSEHLFHHAGQTSFPGGKKEEKDVNLHETALREAKEEIGLDITNVTILGQLPDYNTISGFSVSPIIANLTNPIDLRTDLSLDYNEVAEVFQVPLSYLMNKDNHRVYEIDRAGLKYPIYFIPHENKYIWGATAGMLIALYNHIS